MGRHIFDTRFLVNEALSLLSRLALVKPFALNMPMVTAARVSDAALKAITDLMVSGNRELKFRVHAYVRWLKNPRSADVSTAEAQAAFAILKLRFNALLDQLDIFADVISQRGEQDTGVWVAGLDALATDALCLQGKFYEPPPVMCYLERGHGAAIRRARTRLPGGDMNPVAVIQVPRERMVGSGIASSLIHEVGHQGVALLDLITTIRNAIRAQQPDVPHQTAWNLYDRWLSEILADLWAMGHLGIGATLGLMNVVSLPRYFMFRIKPDDPHPFPWIRVMLSLTFGRHLYPHPQWARMKQLWDSMYPLQQLPHRDRRIIQELLDSMPDFIHLVLRHTSPALKGTRLMDIFPYRGRQPSQLQFLYNIWRFAPEKISTASPSLVFAVIGQAHADANISAGTESKLLAKWLTQWAFLRSEKRPPKESRTVIREIKHLITA